MSEFLQGYLANLVVVVLGIGICVWGGLVDGETGAKVQRIGLSILLGLINLTLAAKLQVIILELDRLSPK